MAVHGAALWPLIGAHTAAIYLPCQLQHADRDHGLAGTMMISQFSLVRLARLRRWGSRQTLL